MFSDIYLEKNEYSPLNSGYSPIISYMYRKLMNLPFHWFHICIDVTDFKVARLFKMHWDSSESLPVDPLIIFY